MLNSNIIKKLEEIKEITNKPLIKEIVQNFLMQSDMELANAPKLIKNLSYLLYILGQNDSSLEITKLVNGISFKGDFEIWTWVEFCLVLQSRIYREKNDLASSKQLINEITNVYSQKESYKKALIRRKNGLLLRYKEIENSVSNNDKKVEMRWRFSQLSQLVFIREMGGSEMLPISKMESEIIENKLLLNQNFELLE